MKKFLALNNEYTYEESDYVILPYGVEESVSYIGGTSLGPKHILEASEQVELFDEELYCNPADTMKFHSLEEENLTGDINFQLNNLRDKISTFLEDNKIPVILGGEHSITPAILSAYSNFYEDIYILHFDAHADLRNDYEGNSNSHACAIRRVVEMPYISAIHSFGIRNISSEEIEFLKNDSLADKMNIYWAYNETHKNLPETFFESLRGKNLYITFDLDGFDSSLMPATGTPEPGGLFWNETCKILKSFIQYTNVIGFDIVELAPKEGFHACDFLAAKLTYKILSYIEYYKKLH